MRRGASFAIVIHCPCNSNAKLVKIVNHRVPKNFNLFESAVCHPLCVQVVFSNDEHTIFLTLHHLRPTPKAVRVKYLELTVAPSPALVAKPSAPEPLSVQSGARIVIVWRAKFHAGGLWNGWKQYHIPNSSVSTDVNLLHIKAALSILTACSCPPHCRTTAQASHLPRQP